MMKISLPISQELISERNIILQKHREAIEAMRRIEQLIEKAMAEDVPWNELEDERNGYYYQLEPLIEDYWMWIPSVKLSQCPMCREDLYHRFDPVDCNGFWWMDRTRRPVKEPEACEHFRMLSGALDLNSKKYEKPLFESFPGPGKPFVIGRILELEGMQAVVSSVEMTCGFIARPICYFSTIQPAKGSLMQSWAQREYYFVNEEGKSGWDIKEEDKDFNLQPWIDKGKVCIEEKELTDE